MGGIRGGFNPNDPTNPAIEPRSPLESLALLTGSVNNSTSDLNSQIAGDPIAPGEPLYFVIDPDAGDTLADAIVQAVIGSVGQLPPAPPPPPPPPPVVVGPQEDTLVGSDGNDRMLAGDTNDLVNGGAGTDSINAGAGNDTVYGGANADTLDGGAGNDSLDGQGGPDLLPGGNGDDTLIWNGAASGADTISSSGGYDTVVVNGDAAANSFTVSKTSIGLLTVTDGAITFVVSSTIPNVVLNGNGGNDTINVGSLTCVVQSSLTINGGDGDDALSAAAVSVGNVRLRLSGDAGNDLLTGSTNNDTLDGGDGLDSLAGGLGNDFLGGGLGNDLLNRNDGDDSLRGDDGSDTLRGSTGNDVISGGDGNDSLESGEGDDTSTGDAGADTNSGDAGSDSLQGDAGNDTIDAQAGNDTVDGGAGDDSLLGSLGRDSLGGEAGQDFLNGGSDDDTLVGGADNDTELGGAGNDLLYGDEVTPQAVSVGNDVLNGQSGNDTVDGGGGNDQLDGGAGNDLLQPNVVDLSASALLLTIDDSTINEGDAGIANWLVTVRLSHTSVEAITVDYSTLDGTALSGADFQPISGTLFFAAGQATRTITVSVHGEVLDEADEQFFIALSNAQGATITDGQATVTILDNDVSAALPRITIEDAVVSAEGNGIAALNFAPASEYRVGDGPVNMVVADLDGDADLDLAVGDSAGTGGFGASALFNAGDGTFPVVTNFPYSGSNAVATTRAFTSGDFDRDGDIDLAGATDPIRGDSGYLLANNGSGTFSVVNFGSGAFGSSSPVELVTGDFDGDGDLDLAGIRGTIISVMMNTGALTFAAPVTYSSAAAITSNTIAAGDLNGDGAVDLVTGNRNSVVPSSPEWNR